MSESTDDESSDSSNEFLVSPDKINLDSSFFTQAAVKTNITKSRVDSDDESENDEDFKDVTGETSTEMFSQILKNLEDSQKFIQDKDEHMDCEPAAKDVLEKSQKGKAIQSKSRGREPNVLRQEISDLLLQGESRSLASQDNNDDSEEENKDDDISSNYKIPEDGVKITLPGTGFVLQRKKNGRTVDTFIREIINRIRTTQMLIHKVGLLCWLGHGFHLNQLINEVELMSAVQTLVTKTQYPKGCVDLSYLDKFTKWFKNLFSIKTGVQEEVINKNTLLQRVKERKLLNYKELVLLYIATLRTMGINCRLIISLHPPDLKVSKNMLPKTKAETDKEKEKKKIAKDKVTIAEEKEKSKFKSTKVRKDKDNTNIKNKTSVAVPENSLEGEKNAKLEARKKAAAILQAKLSSKQNTSTKGNAVPEPTPVAHRTRRAMDIKDNSDKTKKEDPDDESKMTMAKKLKTKVAQNIKDTADSLSLSKASKTESNTLRERKIKASTSKMMDIDSEEDEFAQKQPLKRQAAKLKSSGNTKRRKDESKLTEAEDMEADSPETAKEREDLWAEIYVESERSWICISVMHEKINSVAEVYRRATKPVLYVIAWNSEGSIKDVTRRYCPHWLTVTRKQRVQEKWWTESITAFQEKNTPISKAEDEMLLQKELEKPLPTTISECKGHPLYVLQRHLLKYEALYPSDCVPLGHLRTGEAIYSRYCVHTLYSRETWIKKARVVKPAQEPYKIVKAHLRYDKRTGTKLKDEKLELFGKWQTMDYVPPVAKDGVVPRNEYGNVDLFKQCMLPKGTVHINLPALNRVARKLNIDCAPAVVGFKFSCMGAVPAFEGFVVCEEYEDVLREAWETEQVEAAKREREKREKRVYGNWKKLIAGLLIRRRLAAKYEFEIEKRPSESNREKHRKRKKV